MASFRRRFSKKDRNKTSKSLNLQQHPARKTVVGFPLALFSSLQRKNNRSTRDNRASLPPQSPEMRGPLAYFRRYQVYGRKSPFRPSVFVDSNLFGNSATLSKAQILSRELLEKSTLLFPGLDKRHITDTHNSQGLVLNCSRQGYQVCNASIMYIYRPICVYVCVCLCVNT